MRIVIPDIFIKDCDRVLIVREHQTHSLQVQFGKPLVTTITVLASGEDMPELVIEVQNP